jgi:NADH-quinone oxidoreductase subunit G
VTKIILNGTEVEVDPKEPLIAACFGNGAPVPHYCYHPSMEPHGSCRLCQVEVQEGDRPPRVAAACRTTPTEGMVVNTNAETALDVRREVMEFLLKNHPLDCPICDKAGECALQEHTYALGVDTSRTLEPKQQEAKRRSLGEVIVLDNERCILCTRCVRFFEEIQGRAQLTVAGRGGHSHIDTFGGRDLTGNYQGCITDSCPVGALTLKAFRFQARSWNLLKRASTCGECSRGCSISVEVLRKRDVKRIRPRINPEINKWWICDHGRLSFPKANTENRLDGAVIRSARGALEGAGVEAALEQVRNAYSVHKKHALVVSPWITVEEGEVLETLATELGAALIFVSPPESELKDDFLHTGDPCPNRRGLEELGFEGKSAEEVIEFIGETETVTLVGERIVDLIGKTALGALPGKLRLFVFDCHTLEVAAVQVCIGIPNWVERGGHWINIDGKRGPISSARPTPPQVRPLRSLIGDLVHDEAPTEVPS